MPRLGRQDLDALGQQQRGFALHLGTVLEFIDVLDALRQGLTQTRQRFTRQRGAGFGRVALPRHGICHFELVGLQQSLGFVGPLLGQGVLGFGSLEFVEFFAQELGSSLVACAHFFKNLLH